MKMFYGARGVTFRNASRHRKELTKAEQILWECFSKNQLNGHRFRRQHPIGNYIVDFYCHKAKLALEIDGQYHNMDDQKIKDMNRTTELNLLGVTVLRFTNEEVEFCIEKVLDNIKKYLPGSQIDQIDGFQVPFRGFRGQTLNHR